MFWSCLLGAIIQFARIFFYDVVIALTSEFSFTADITLVKGSHRKLFEDESLESHPIHAPFLFAFFITIYAFHKEAGEEEQTWNSPPHFPALQFATLGKTNPKIDQ